MKSLKKNDLLENLKILKKEGLKKLGINDLKKIDKKTIENLELYRSIIKKVVKLKNEKRKVWIKKQNEFDSDYYEQGIQTKKSGYENYRWIPELTMRMVHHMIIDLNIKKKQKILDFGCAKGYSVKSFRMFDIDAYGVDISSYAIQSVIPDKWGTQEHCKLIVDWEIPFKNIKFDWIIAKDAIEHLNEEELIKFLKMSKKIGKNIFTAVPLGRKIKGKERFVIENYEGDITHIIRKSPQWWKKIFESQGWKVKSFKYNMPSIKENWTISYPKGNGFFILERN
tara:strand:- start:584 stop:1429 length:846 start_codon:yes stop_codon:yes gene_type:complete